MRAAGHGSRAPYGETETLLCTRLDIGSDQNTCVIWEAILKQYQRLSPPLSLQIGWTEKKFDTIQNMFRVQNKSIISQ